MNTIRIFSFLILSLLLVSCNNQNKKETKKIDQSISKIEVLDFHSTHRCVTCNAIETNTIYTLETFFAKEMEEQKITFQSLNVDDTVNTEISERFEVAGTSLFLNVIKNGKETHINLTDFAFMKGRNKEAFSDELKSKIKSELAKL